MKKTYAESLGPHPPPQKKKFQVQNSANTAVISPISFRLSQGRFIFVSLNLSDFRKFSEIAKFRRL